MHEAGPPPPRSLRTGLRLLVVAQRGSGDKQAERQQAREALDRAALHRLPLQTPRVIPSWGPAALSREAWRVAAATWRDARPPETCPGFLSSPTPVRLFVRTTTGPKGKGPPHRCQGQAHRSTQDFCAQHAAPRPYTAT